MPHHGFEKNGKAAFRISGNTISSNGLPINRNAPSPHGNLVNFLGEGTSVMTLTVTSGTTGLIGRGGA